MCGLWAMNLEKPKTTFQKFKDVEEVKAELAHNMPKNHYILIKGSNGTKAIRTTKIAINNSKIKI